MYLIFRICCWVCLPILFFSCKETKQQQNEGSNTPTQLTKPNKNDYAKGFALTHTENFKLLHIFSPFQDSEDTLSYILLPKKGVVPDAYSYYTRINTPIESMVSTSTTHIAMIAHLGKSATIAAVSDPDFIYNDDVKNAIATGDIKEAGRNGQINLEIILALNTSLVMSGAWSTAAFDTYTPLINAGVPVLVNSEWTEPHPLGRMEWIKVFGALFNEETKAKTLFKESKEKYLSLVETIEAVELEKPTVINGMPYQEAWSIAGGNSYVGKLLQHAGADWHWATDTTTVSLQLDFETVYQVGEQADIWIAPGRTESIADIKAVDERFANFKSVQSGKVFNYHNRTNKTGMYDYFESGVVKPELILADLIKIFHPEILPEHKLYYYKKAKL